MKVSSLLVQCLCFSVYLLKHWLFLSRDQSLNAGSYVGPLCGSLKVLWEWEVQLRLDILFSQPSHPWVVRPAAPAYTGPLPTRVHLEESARRFKPPAPSWGPLHPVETPESFQWKHSLPTLPLSDPPAHLPLSPQPHHQPYCIKFSTGPVIQKISEVK